MKTRKDFMSMKPIDLFLYNSICQSENSIYEKQLKFYKMEMEKTEQKYEIAKQKYDEVMLKKADNMQEWMLCQKVAKQRKIDLHRIVLNFTD